MKPFPITRIIELVRAFSVTMTSAELAAPVANTEEEAKRLAEQVQSLIDECNDWGFALTADQFIRIKDQVGESGMTNGKIAPLMTDALNRLQDECKRVVVTHIEYKHLEYFNNPQFFDSQEKGVNKVSVAFP